MSNYIMAAIHPRTGKIDLDATWMDNYFGRHKYGVQFSDGSIYPAKEVNVPESAKPTLDD